MALWTGWTLQQLQVGIANLRSAIATGALRVRFGDRDVTYQSLSEMERTLSGMITELNAIQNPPLNLRRVRSIVLSDRSGW